MSTKMHVYYGPYIVAEIDRNAAGSEFGDGPPFLEHWHEALPGIWIPSDYALYHSLGGIHAIDGDESQVRDEPLSYDRMYHLAAQLELFRMVCKNNTWAKSGLVIYYL